MRTDRLTYFGIYFGKGLRKNSIQKVGFWTLLTMGLLGSSVAAGQQNNCSYTLSGNVLDQKTQEPIPYVTVQIKGSEKVAITDVKGTFYFEGLCSPKNTLIVHCIGYCDTSCESYYHGGERPNIYLTQETTELKSVTIQAEKLVESGTASLSQTTLDRSDFSVNSSQDLASVVSQEQGVTFTSAGNNVQLPVIHGLYGNRILVLNNGFKHGFQNWGRDHAPEIDISSAHEVTVIKGAAGTRYGPEALGGAVSIKNNPLLLNDPLKVRVGSGYQTNGRGYFAQSEISQGLSNWGYHAAANYMRSGDKHTPDYSLTNSGKEEFSFNTGVRYHLKGLDVKLFYSFIEQDLALLRSSIASSGAAFINAIESDRPYFIRPFSYDINEPKQTTQHHLGKAEINWWISEKSLLTFRYGVQLNKRQEFDVRRNADLPIIDLDLTTNDYQLEWKHPAWLGMTGLVGVQYFTQENLNNPGTNTTALIPNYLTKRYSGFIIESIKKDQNTFEFGVRVDSESNNVAGRETNQDLFRDQFSFVNLTASLGYIRKLNENSTFRTHLGTAWRTPNMAELYTFGQHGFKTSYGLLRYYFNEEGDPRTDKVLTWVESGVQPEKGYKFINEYRTQFGENTHTFTAYAHYIENFIYERPLGVFGTIRGPMPAFIFQQYDAAFLGLDYSWQRNWTRQWSGTLGVSYLWSHNVERDEPLINQAPINVNYNLSWQKSDLWFFESSKISIRPSYTFEQYQAPRTVSPQDLIDGTVEITPESEIFDFKDAPSGYFLFDLAWEVSWGNLDASIAVNNVFNTRYRYYLNEMRYFADEPGTNVLFTLHYTFKGKRTQDPHAGHHHD